MEKCLSAVLRQSMFISLLHWDTYIRINVDKNNVDSIPMLLDTLKDLGISHSQVDFGITRDSTSACSSYKSNCLPEEYLPDILNELWKYSEANMFSKYRKILNLCNLNRWQLQGALGYANIQILAHSRSLEILHCQQSCRRSSAFLQRAFCP